MGAENIATFSSFLFLGNCQQQFFYSENCHGSVSNIVWELEYFFSHAKSCIYIWELLSCDCRIKLFFSANISWELLSCDCRIKSLSKNTFFFPFPPPQVAPLRITQSGHTGLKVFFWSWKTFFTCKKATYTGAAEL